LPRPDKSGLAMTGRRSAKRMKRVRLCNRLRKAFEGHSRGFTLVEVLITVALIGVIAVAFFSFMSAAASALIHADERTIAESLARSQMEYVKNQGYNSTQPGGEAIYEEIAPIPDGYSICSVNRDGEIVNDVIGIPWDSAGNKTAISDTGLQMVALVIKHQDAGGYKVIYTFVNNNPNWADGVPITLEGYVRQS
jgi:prepilin-type N-terminal cleavage/methylation domain-containing protein